MPHLWTCKGHLRVEVTCHISQNKCKWLPHLGNMEVESHIPTESASGIHSGWWRWHSHLSPGGAGTCIFSKKVEVSSPFGDEKLQVASPYHLRRCMQSMNFSMWPSSYSRSILTVIYLSAHIFIYSQDVRRVIYATIYPSISLSTMGVFWEQSIYLSI